MVEFSWRGYSTRTLSILPQGSGNILLKQKPGVFPGLTDQLASLRSKYFSNLRLTRCRALSMDFTWRWSSSAISW